jgi:hypothetical protein
MHYIILAYQLSTRESNKVELALFRRVTVSLALEWLETARTVKPRASIRSFQKRFHHRDGGPERLKALIFAKSPSAWKLP